VIVLDTHAWIWWTADPDRLSGRARHAIEQATEVGIAAISCWEVAMLVEKARLDLDRDVLVWVQQALAQPRCTLLPLTAEVAVAAARLGSEGSDPADRLIAATAISQRAALVTTDQRLRRSKHLQTIW
jgi:PIN domain nuclease of toxin-antitoxin system